MTDIVSELIAAKIDISRAAKLLSVPRIKVSAHFRGVSQPTPTQLQMYSFFVACNNKFGIKQVNSDWLIGRMKKQKTDATELSKFACISAHSIGMQLKNKAKIASYNNAFYFFFFRYLEESKLKISELPDPKNRPIPQKKRKPRTKQNYPSVPLAFKNSIDKFARKKLSKGNVKIAMSSIKKGKAVIKIGKDYFFIIMNEAEWNIKLQGSDFNIITEAYIKY